MICINPETASVRDVATTKLRNAKTPTGIRYRVVSRPGHHEVHQQTLASGAVVDSRCLAVYRDEAAADRVATALSLAR
jgi:hypothetical protein